MKERILDDVLKVDVMKSVRISSVEGQSIQDRRHKSDDSQREYEAQAGTFPDRQMAI